MKGKKSMKKLRIGALLLAGCLLAGCGSTEKTETKKDEKIKLQVTYSLKELGSDETDVETIFAGYLKEHPNIEIESIPMSGSNSQMMSMIAAGNAPDIIRLSGFEDIPTYVSRKMIIPLDDYIAKSKVIDLNDLNDSVNLFRYDGKERGKGSIYGCVKDWSVDTQLWINKKLFREAGVNIPEENQAMTWDELCDAAKKITKINKDGSIERIGMSISTPMPLILEMMLTQRGESLWTDDYKGTTLTKSPVIKEVFEYYTNLQKSGVMASKLNPVDDEMAWFTSGKIGIMMSGYWAKAVMENAGDEGKVSTEDIALIPSPVVNKGERFAAILSGAGAGISADSKHKDEAYELWEYIHFGELADMRAKKGFGMPATKAREALLPVNTEFEKSILASTLDDAKYLRNDIRINPYVNFASEKSVFDKYYVPVLYGTSTVDEALKEIDKELTALISEGMEIAGESKK